MKKTHVAVLVAFVWLITLTSAVLMAQWNFNYHGSMATVGVEAYSDVELTQLCSDLDVGMVVPGTNTSQVIYVLNAGNIPLVLTLTAVWDTPEQANVLSLTWNCENTVLNAGESVIATFTLTVAEVVDGIIGFNAVVTITGTNAL